MKIGLARRLSFLLLMVSLGSTLFAQFQSAKSTSAGKAAPTPVISSRFLGWKYAALAHQDVTKWKKPGTARARGAEPSDKEVKAARRSLTMAAGASFPIPGLAAHAILPTGYLPTAVVAGDFNEDGKMDLAISNGGDNTITILLGKGDGTFQLPELLYTAGQSPSWITTARLSSSGHLDLIVADGDSKIIEVFNGKGDGTFTPGVQATVPQIPSFVAAGDFNHDGKQDILVGLVIDAGAVEPPFEVLFGNGSGSFSGTLMPPKLDNPFDAPLSASWYSVGDVNVDGFDDIVATWAGAESQLYLNSAGSEFVVSDPFNPWVSPFVMELADLNGDGCPDAVFVDARAYVEVETGNCDGTFNAAAHPIGFAGDYDYALKVVDVDGDGKLDVVASAATVQGGGPGYGLDAGYLVSVLRGDGKGGLSAPAIYSGTTDQYSLAVADLNGDGYPEIVTIGPDTNNAVLLTNDGSGGFGAPQGISLGDVETVENNPIPGSVMQALDVNGDGKPDLFAIEFGDLSTSNLKLTVIPNVGGGKFGPPIRTPEVLGDVSTSYSPAYVLGNFRGKGNADVVLLNISPVELTNYLGFVPSNGDGTYGAMVPIASFPDQPYVIAAGDFNGDKKLDFAIVAQSATDGTKMSLMVYLGHGDGTFEALAPQLFPFPAGFPQTLISGDFNHDGKLDLLLGCNTNMGWTLTGDPVEELIGHGDGTFSAPVVLFSHFGEFAVADVNHDGFLDLIQARVPSATYDDFGMYPPGVTVYLGAADGSFVQQTPYALPGFSEEVVFAPKLAIGDFDGDGNLDIAVRYHDGLDSAVSPAFSKVRILRGVGDGTFLVGQHEFPLQYFSAPFVGADFDGDGKTDLVDLSGFTSSFVTIPAAPGPSLDIAFDDGPLVADTAEATVTLNYPQSSDVDVTVASSDPAVTVPATLHFPAGTTAQSFTMEIGAGLDTTHATAISATLGSETAVAYSMRPNPNAATGIDLYFFPSKPVGIAPGDTFKESLYIQSVRGYYGNFSNLQCSGLPAGASCAFDLSSFYIGPGVLQPINLEVSTETTTPAGNYTVQITTTDGFIVGSMTFDFSVGDFSVSATPTSVLLGVSGGVATTNLTINAINGLQDPVTITCTGLPAGVSCASISPVTPNSSLQFAITENTAPAAGDYPFEIVGTVNSLTHNTSMTLHVEDFTASIDKSSATIASGQSATFTISLASVNQYSNSIAILCSEASGNITLSCVPSPSSVSLAAGEKTSVTLTVTAPAASTTERKKSAGRALASPFALALLPLILLFGGRRYRRVRTALLAILFIVLWVSCGGGGGNNGGSSPPPPQSQTVKLNLSAAANDVGWDPNNVKTLGPLTITVQ